MKIPTAEQLKFLNYQDEVMQAIDKARKEAIQHCNRFIELNAGNNEACSDRLAALDHELSAIQAITTSICEINRRIHYAN